MSAKISIIIPVYNVEKYLPECLDSIIAQTLSDIEIICINDGSPDNSLSILKDYAAKDSRIIIIDKENEGVGKARNDGMRAASGEFIAFMDSDDYYPNPEVLEKLYTAAKEHNVKICGGKKVILEVDSSFTKTELFSEEYGVQFGAKGLADFSDLQYDYGYWMYIYDRNLLVENNIFFPPYRRFQDPPFFVNAMIAAGKYYALDFETYCYRMVPTAAKYKLQNTLDFLKGVTDNLNAAKAHNLPKLHYLSAMRLDKEGSFMATQNLFDERRRELIAAIIKAANAVDVAWLRESGFDIPLDYVPEVFLYAVSTAEKYEKIRNNKVLKAANKFLRK